MTAELRPELAALFQELFPALQAPVTASLAFTDIPGLDSFGKITLALGAEKKFGLHFSAHNITALRTVGDLAALIEGKRSV